ncbi:ABC transporter permease [Paenibacillus sp. 481]|uniref:ABC transporter permease n=1 Tax=Paenibacillus sp. 481 TaxID=2835869 RepID=UPI001E60B454|nr:ABC transporter permease [Paenibacillus sp. 481]
MNLLSSEWIKLRRSNIWLLMFVSPALAALIGLMYNVGSDEQMQWPMLLSVMGAAHVLLFLPLLAGVFSAFVCRYEHAGGGWKQMLALPMSRSSLYITKMLLVSFMLLVTQLLFISGVVAIGCLRDFATPVPWAELVRSGFNSWVATLPLAALQMFVSVAWSSFAAPLAINVMLTMPNLLIVNSERFGPFYPWVQPALSMLPRETHSYGAFNVSMETLLLVIIGGFVVFFVGGLTYFQRKEI